MSERGTRVIDGKHMWLCGRGSKAHCRKEADALRRSWRYVRVVPANPFDDQTMRELLDDYMIYVFEPKPRSQP